MDEERQSIISMLRLLVVGMQLNGTKYPQDMLDELDRAEWDYSIDIMELAARFNDYGPQMHETNLSQVTFRECNRVQGRLFSVMYPDGWGVIKNYVDRTLIVQTRPFVAAPKEAIGAGEEDISLSDRIMYSSMSDSLDHEDANSGAADRLGDEQWLNLLKEGVSNTGFYKVVWSEIVDAENVKCLIVQQETRGEGANGLEFNVYPRLAGGATDFLRVIFSYREGMDMRPARDIVRKMAKSIRVDNPSPASSVQTGGQKQKKEADGLSKIEKEKDITVSRLEGEWRKLCKELECGLDGFLDKDKAFSSAENHLKAFDKAKAQLPKHDKERIEAEAVYKKLEEPIEEATKQLSSLKRDLNGSSSLIFLRRKTFRLQFRKEKLKSHG